MLTSKLGMCGVLTSVILGAAGCSHDGQGSSTQTASKLPGTTPASSPTAAPIDSSAPSELGVTNLQPAGPSTGLDTIADPSTPLVDDDIVAILEAINTTQIQQAQLARAKGRSSAVKNLADTIMVENTVALQQVQAMATQWLLVANTGNSTLQALVTDLLQEIDTLRSKGGGDFDTAYIDEMVRGHQKSLSLIDETLIPTARNGELKAHLRFQKAHMEAQLRVAEDVQHKLSGLR